MMNRENRHMIASLAGSRRHDIAYWGLMALACLAFFVMNALTTFKEDDLGFFLVDGEWTPITSLADALRSLHNHYQGTNGRLADVIAMVFCAFLGKGVFNVCNTIVFGLMSHLLSLLSTGRKSVLAIVAFWTVVGTCYPVPGETMLWLAGSCNYMWAITSSLALIYYLLCHDNSKLGWGGCALLALLAVMAGGFNEATSIGVFVGLCLYYVFNFRKVNRAVVMALCGYLLGFLVIVSSPAAWSRAADGGIVVNLGFSQLFSSRSLIFTEKMWRFVTPVLSLIVGVVSLFFKRGRSAARHSVWGYIFVSMALVMFALGLINERAYAPLVTVAFIIVMMVADWILSRWQGARTAVILAALALMAFTWARGIMVLKQYKAYEEQTVSEIVNAPDQAILHERQFDGYSRFIKPMNNMSTNFFAHEVVYCAYYDKENVQFVNDSIYERYHSGRLLEGAISLPLTSDPPQIVDSVLAVQGQDYMAVVLHTDTLPWSFQTARYYIAPTTKGMTEREMKRRTDYGLVTDYNPRGFFPLRYQGRTLLIFPLINSQTSHIVFPMALGSKAPEVTLTPDYRPE
jgi:hypothetical protein